MPKTIAQGSKDFGDAWIDWWMLPRLTDDEVRDFLDANDICYYGGVPGSAYGRKPWIRHSASYTLIQQWCGMDI